MGTGQREKKRRRENRGKEKVWREKAGNGDKGEKAACFKSIFLKEDVEFSQGYSQGSHRPRAMTLLTSARQGVSI